MRAKSSVSPAASGVHPNRKAPTEPRQGTSPHLTQLFTFGCSTRRRGACYLPPAPSPGTPGEGRGQGFLHRRPPLFKREAQPPPFEIAAPTSDSVLHMAEASNRGSAGPPPS